MVNAASETTRLSAATAVERIGRTGAHRGAVGELGGGRLAAAAQAGAHRVDGEPPAERQEGRPEASSHSVQSPPFSTSVTRACRLMRQIGAKKRINVVRQPTSSAR